eukprot:CAMPEP_0170563754 /NCGR_PEP_ID=MMETSP0211-20121228/68692_1 /TAXON_ID=311385 /ORGANISM="Pseudokeronopsis sp., Strain OXSARD2" /LENGTH=62 /DNA_ID=CAMNT_0010882383 /DNA_START=371 /DNA_END=559 /DNA_ORIENTATION=-
MNQEEELVSKMTNAESEKEVLEGSFGSSEKKAPAQIPQNQALFSHPDRSIESGWNEENWNEI